MRGSRGHGGRLLRPRVRVAVTALTAAVLLMSSVPIAAAQQWRMVTLIRVDRAPVFARSAGNVSLGRSGSDAAFVILASGMPRAPKAAYGVWLTAVDGNQQFVGFFGTQPRRGNLEAEDKLPERQFARYQFMELTLEHSDHPTVPTDVILRGRLPR